jgi:hypothetical protein
MQNKFGNNPNHCFLVFLSLCLCVSAVNLSCGSKPVNLRALAPAETLVYLETNDLGKTLSAITENKNFVQLAKNKPDLSALKGIQLAVAVTGFETVQKSESGETSEAGGAVLDLKPRFVAVAETHAWNYQALSFTENKLGEFINQAFGGGVVLDAVDKNGGRWFTWSAEDGLKAFAFVQGSQVFFGNDEPAIEKCLAVKRGEAESLSAGARLPEPAENTLASGYISPDGVAQVSNIAAIGLAKRAGDDEEVQKFIAGLLPQLLRNTAREVSWTASKTEQGIEDRITIAANPEVSSVFKETLVVSGNASENLALLLPADVFSVTRYDLKDPQIAWRSVLLTGAQQSGTAKGNVLIAYSGSLFEPYGVEDGEAFLSAVDGRIVTAKFDAEGEEPVVIVTVKDAAKVKRSIVKEVNFIKQPEKQGDADVWRSDDGDIAAAFFENRLILGDAESVMKCLQARAGGPNFSGTPFYQQFSEIKAVAVTYGREVESAGKIVDVIGDRKSENENLPLIYLTETRFNEKAIERKTVSDFGLIGSIIEMIGGE